MKKSDFKKNLIEELKYPEEIAEELIQYVDNERDIESLNEKIKILDKYGVNYDGVEIILADNPLFLTTPVDTVKASLNFLKNIKIDNLGSLIQINSELLSTSDKTMSENYKLLKIVIPNERELINMLNIDSEILSFNTEYFERRLEFLIKNGLKDKIKEIILNYFDVFEDEEDEINIKELKDSLE